MHTPGQPLILPRHRLAVVAPRGPELEDRRLVRLAHGAVEVLLRLGRQGQSLSDRPSARSTPVDPILTTPVDPIDNVYGQSWEAYDPLPPCNTSVIVHPRHCTRHRGVHPLPSMSFFKGGKQESVCHLSTNRRLCFSFEKEVHATRNGPLPSSRRGHVPLPTRSRAGGSATRLHGPTLQSTPRSSMIGQITQVLSIDSPLADFKICLVEILVKC